MVSELLKLGKVAVNHLPGMASYTVATDNIVCMQIDADEPVESPSCLKSSHNYRPDKFS